MLEQRKQHLYLAFDDWNSGYSIRKVNLSRRSDKQLSDSGEDSDEQSGLKPLPVFMRIRALRGYPRLFASAFGTKIIALHPSTSYGGDNLLRGVPTIDVQDHTISFDTPPSSPLFPLYIPVSDKKLFALDFFTFEVLRKQPEPSSGLWMWGQVPHPPFLVSHVLSYGVQPDGCILVSTSGGKTFIFDTNKEHEWKQCGDWVFPFTGHGHYDPSLEGFVGLAKDLETLGYLYCCTMASTATIGGDTDRTWFPSPDVKRTEDKVYNKDPTEGADEGQHVSAILMHMRQGKFCLVECVCTDNTTTAEDEPELKPGDDGCDSMGGGPQGGRFMYRVKTFNLSYDTKGDLKLRHCKVRRYSLPHEARIGSIHQNPVAFWL